VPRGASAERVRAAAALGRIAQMCLPPLPEAAATSALASDATSLSMAAIMSSTGSSHGSAKSGSASRPVSAARSRSSATSRDGRGSGARAGGKGRGAPGSITGVASACVMGLMIFFFFFFFSFLEPTFFFFFFFFFFRHNSAPSMLGPHPMLWSAVSSGFKIGATETVIEMALGALCNVTRSADDVCVKYLCFLFCFFLLPSFFPHHKL
jgi:hypothetical protein